MAERADDDLDLVALDPSGVRAAAGLERRRAAARWSCSTCGAAMLHPLPPTPGEVVSGAAFTRDERALLIGQRGPDGAAAAEPHPARRAGRPDGRPRCWPRCPADVERLVTPTLHEFAGRGRADPVRLAVPAARGARRAAHPALAARRAGGPGAADLPAAVPGAGRGGGRGVRAERARLRRLRAQLRRRRRPGAAGSSRSPTSGRRSSSWPRPGWPTPAGSGSPGGPTAAT